MFGVEALDLARIQFAFTVSFHIIFPAITIGLASYLAVIHFLWLKTDKAKYRTIYKFWSNIFAVNFGMGVVSGVVMAFQFCWVPLLSLPLLSRSRLKSRAHSLPAEQLSKPRKLSIRTIRNRML